MRPDIINIMSEKTRQTFSEYAQAINAEDKTRLQTLVDSVLKELLSSIKNTDSEYPAKRVMELFDNQFPDRSDVDREKLQIGFAAELALSIESRLARENLPDRVLSYYPMYLDRVINSININKGPLLINYASLLTLQSIPCGAEMMDLKSAIPITTAVLSLIRMRDPRPLLRYFCVKGTGIWFRSHTDVGYLDEFSREGFDQYYLTVAEILKTRPQVSGLVSTSWFHDPKVGDISPRLSYLFSDPMARGAFIFKHRSTHFDIQSATKKSATRKKLYDKGEYTPISYSIIWPRKALLAWAEELLSSNRFRKKKHD